VEGLGQGLRNSAVVLLVAVGLAGALYALRADERAAAVESDEPGEGTDSGAVGELPTAPAQLAPDPASSSAVVAWRAGEAELGTGEAIVVALGAALAADCDERVAEGLLSRVAAKRPSGRVAEALAAAALPRWADGGATRCAALSLELVEVLARTEALGPGARSRLALAALAPDPPGGERLVALLDSGAPENPTWAKHLTDLALDAERRPGTRAAACRALRRRRVAPAALVALGADPAVGGCVVRSSRRWGDEAPARAALASPHRELRIAAAHTLQLIAEPEATEPLLAGLLASPAGERETQARVRAAGYLLRTNPTRAADLRAALEPGLSAAAWASDLDAAQAQTVESPAPRCDAWLTPGELAPAVADATARLGPAPRLCLRPGAYSGDLRVLDAGLALWAPAGPTTLSGELLLAAPASIAGLTPTRLVADPGAAGSVLLGVGDTEADLAADLLRWPTRLPTAVRLVRLGPTTVRDGVAWVRPEELTPAERTGEAAPERDATLPSRLPAVPAVWPPTAPPGEPGDWAVVVGGASGPGALALWVQLLPGAHEPGQPALVAVLGE